MPTALLALVAFVVVGATAALAGCGIWFLDTRGEPLGEGDRAPDVSLPDADGNVVTLDRLLASGPAVLVFYRGHW